MPKQSVNKAQWIRDNDASTPAAELIAKAKREGVTITAAQIYTTRAETKKRAASGSVPPPKPSASETGGSIDALIRVIVREEIKRYFTDR